MALCIKEVMANCGKRSMHHNVSGERQKKAKRTNLVRTRFVAALSRPFDIVLGVLWPEDLLALAEKYKRLAHLAQK